MNDIRRVIAANHVAKMTALANAKLVYSKQIADLLTFRRQFASPTEAFLGIQADYTRLLSQFDVSHVVVAAEALRRMGGQISSTNYTLIQQVTFPALEVAQKTLSGFAPTAQMIAQFQSQLHGIAQLVDQYVSGTLEPLRKLAERAGRTQSVCDAFQAYGLWLAPSMPEELVKKVVDFHNRGVSSGSVHSSVVRYYAKNNWETLDNILSACDGNANFVDRGETIR